MTQPEALMHAEWLETKAAVNSRNQAIAAELRRLHEVNQELLEALKWCAGTSYIDTANQVAVEAIKKATGESK